MSVGGQEKECAVHVFRDNITSGRKRIKDRIQDTNAVISGRI